MNYSEQQQDLKLSQQKSTPKIKQTFFMDIVQIKNVF